MRRKELMKRGLAILIASAMILSGCGSDNNTSPASSTKDTNTEKTENVSDDRDNKTPENDTKLSEDDTKISKDDSKTSENDDKTSENNTNLIKDKNNSNENIIDSQVITSGEFYDTIQSICPGSIIMELEDNVRAVSIDISCIKDTDHPYALFFSKTAARILAKSNFQDIYDDISFTYIDDGSYSQILISDFKNIGDFTSSLVALSPDDEYFSKNMNSYYNDLFGCFDRKHKSDQFYDDLYEEYGIEHDKKTTTIDCDSFWLFSSFYDDIASYKNNDNKLSVVLQKGYEDTDDSGYKFCSDLLLAVDICTNIYNSSPGNLTFDSFDITCISESTEDNLCTVSLSIDQSSGWKVDNLLIYGTNFQNGFKRKNNE